MTSFESVGVRYEEYQWGFSKLMVSDHEKFAVFLCQLSELALENQK